MSIVLDTALLNNNANPVLKLVQGDTEPTLIVNLYNELNDSETGSIVDTVIDVSTSVVRLKIRLANTTDIVDTVVGHPIPGLLQADGSIIFTAPYNIAGTGGRVAFFWNENSLSKAGSVEGEIEITFPDGRVQTVYRVIKMRVRGQF